MCVIHSPHAHVFIQYLCLQTISIASLHHYIHIQTIMVYTLILLVILICIELLPPAVVQNTSDHSYFFGLDHCLNLVFRSYQPR